MNPYLHMYYYIKEKIQFEKESQYENCNQYDFDAKTFNNNRRRFFLSFYISVSDFSGSQKKKKLFSPECVPKINSRRS